MKLQKPLTLNARSSLNWRAWLPSRGNVLFTLLAIAALIVTQRAWASPAITTVQDIQAISASATTMTYQGYLTDSNDNPLDGAQPMVFRFYNVASGGTHLWEEVWTGVDSITVNDGYFTVILGSRTPIPSTVVAGNDSLWLGITVGTADLPRAPVSSVPYALHALTVADNSITTSKLADGVVTDAKIANNAAEPDRTLAWADDTTYAFPGDGSQPLLVDTGLTLTVPPGKAYYYLVLYTGKLKYEFGERNGSQSGFYARWNAALLANSDEIGVSTDIVRTGYRLDWAANGGSSYWYTPYEGSWIVRLTEGSYPLKIRISGYSDSTMNTAHVDVQRLQIVRIP
jgi:hypothetical protein